MKLPHLHVSLVGSPGPEAVPFQESLCQTVCSYWVALTCQSLSPQTLPQISLGSSLSLTLVSLCGVYQSGKIAWMSLCSWCPQNDAWYFKGKG